MVCEDGQLSTFQLPFIRLKLSEFMGTSKGYGTCHAGILLAEHRWRRHYELPLQDKIVMAIQGSNGEV